MDFSLDEVDLGFVVSLETLRDVLKSMSLNGRKWWDRERIPADAIENPYRHDRARRPGLS